MKKEKISLFVCLLLVFIMIFSINTQEIKASESTDLKVTFLNVGQGDGALIESNGKYMLVDAGVVSSGPLVTEFLKSKGITKLDYIVASHDHQDHIGGFIDVINNFKVDNIIKTKNQTTESAAKEFYSLINQKNIPVIYPKAGDTMRFGLTDITFVAPNSSYYDIYNNNSLVFRLVYGDNSFLFTGDAEALSEQEMLQKGYTLKSDVLKVGHHSALTSSTDEFIKAVDPAISLISCDEYHKAEFPRITTLRKLTKSNIYRTDKENHITMTSDGSTIEVDKPAYSYAGSSIDIVNGAVTRTISKETRLLGNVKAHTNYGDFELVDRNGDVTYDKIYDDYVVFDFSADCGISRLKEVQYALDPEDVFYEYSELEWETVENDELVISEDFSGIVYFKFINQLGNTVVRKTNGFTVDATAPTDCTVTSNLKSISLITEDKKNSYNTHASSAVTLNFDADFGISGKQSIEYMLVERGKAFNSKGTWINGSTVTIKNNFIGRVYVRFTDGVGHRTILKTTGFSWVKKNPINTVVKSRIPEIKFTTFNSKPGNIINVPKQITLTFSADFGASREKSIEYMIVKKGERYKASGEWTKGNKVTIKKGFTGRVYVRFTDNNGNRITKMTNYFNVTP